MPNFTKTLNLEKPLRGEFYAIEKHNENSDKIDLAIEKITVPTIEHLKNMIKLQVGDIVDLQGYYTAGDGAHHKRKIEATDDGSGVQLANGLWANIVHNGEVNVSWFGAKGDGVSDDTIAIQSAIELGTVVTFLDKTYLFENVNLKNSCTIRGVREKTTFIGSGVHFRTYDNNSYFITLKDFICRYTGDNGITIVCGGVSNHNLIFEGIRTTNSKHFILWGEDENGVANNTFLWNIMFRDMRISETKAEAFKNRYVGNANFGFYFENVYFDRCFKNLSFNGVEANFDSCNIGIYGINSINTGNATLLSFKSTNFECDRQVTGNGAIYLGNSLNKFIDCSFYQNSDVDVKFMKGFSGHDFIFKDCSYKRKSGNEIFWDNSSVPRYVSTDAVGDFSDYDSVSYSNNKITRYSKHINVRKVFNSESLCADGELYRKTNMILFKDGSDIKDCYGNTINSTVKISGINEVIERMTVTTNLSKGQIDIPKKYKSVCKNVKISLKQDSDSLFQNAQIRHDLSDRLVLNIFSFDYNGAWQTTNQTTTTTTLYVECVYDYSEGLMIIFNLDTPYYTIKMQQEGVYEDFIEYMDEQLEYDKQQRELEEQRQLAFENREDKGQSYEDWLSTQPQLMPFAEPQPSQVLLDFKEKYLG